METSVLVGLVVGLAVGLTSCGAGSLLTPALVMLLGLPPSVAVGTSAFTGAVMKVFGGGGYAQRKAVHWPTVLRLAAGSVPGAATGVTVLNLLPPELVDVVIAKGLGLAMVLVGIAVIRRAFAGDAQATGRLPPTWVTVLIGFAIGALVSVTSVGSGSLVMCVLTQFYPLPAAVLVGTDLVHAVLLSGTSALGHAVSGRVDFSVSLAVLAGAVPGALVGSRLATALPERPLRSGLALIVLASGIQLAFFDTPKARPSLLPAAVAAEVSHDSAQELAE